MTSGDDPGRPGADRRLADGREGGAVLARISTRIVRLYKEYYGKGPTKAKTRYRDDLVVVLLEGGFTTVEETLLREGRGAAVVSQRRRFQEVMADRFNQVVEEELGRKVVAFLGGTHQAPDMMAKIFVLEAPGEVLADPDVVLADPEVEDSSSA